MKNKVLIIDDDYSVREFYKTFLVENGYEVLTAEDGNEGYEVFKNNKPDLILLDISMPQKNGLDVLREIREVDEDIPVFLLTAYEEHKRNFASLYADEYFVKTKKPSLILDRMKKTIERRKAKIKN
ncbi:MAG: two-component system, OmpR family, response regulator Irr [Deferribacteres bacterium]|jgi:DNA-binding response OmpR family regulator|nr:two-component system, OmpR family, response regulator Irr [Deferribacteres bacterium]